MINWLLSALNVVWIMGCAVILAAFSHAFWLAHARGARVRQLLSAPATLFSFSLGLFLISLGLCLLGQDWLERAVWAAFAVAFAWQSWIHWQREQRPPQTR